MPSTSPPVAAITLSLAKPDPVVGNKRRSPEVPEPEVRAAELVSLANAHEQAERLNEAEEALHEALAVAPGHAEALHLLGIVSFKQGWVEKQPCSSSSRLELHATRRSITAISARCTVPSAVMTTRWQPAGGRLRSLQTVGQDRAPDRPDRRPKTARRAG
jgi:hypothetical protein